MESISRRIHSPVWIVAASALSCAFTWGLAELCFLLDANRATAAMLLLLAVLAIATLGDSVVALVASASASLAFSWYFIEVVGNLRITSAQGGMTFAAMTLTAITGSQLSIRAQRRTAEAELRRAEMERLNELCRVLLSAETVAEAAENAVKKLVELFGIDGAVVRIEGVDRIFEAGRKTSGPPSIVSLSSGTRRDALEIYGSRPSGEVRSAIASTINLVLERARTSEERARIEASQRAEELRATVLNALAHNFKTPLTSIKVAASALRSTDGVSSPDSRELVAAIDEEADRLDQLISESLDLAKIEAYRHRARRDECSIPEIVERITARVARYLGRREFLIDIPENIPPVLGDRFLLEQMLIQVVDNAWKYSRPGSAIRLSAELEGDRILLSVRNEGSEIPECERALIFGRFYRGARDRSRVEGTGLGLAIAKTIAEACGGKVWLDMEPRGPAFHFALPREAAGTRE